MSTRSQRNTLRIGLITLATVSAIAHAEPATKPSTVTVTREEWTDVARSRTLPVKIYLPATNNAKWPVIFLSHGLGGTRESISYAGEPWAQAGFLVIALQHPGSDDSVWRGKPPAEVAKSLQDAISPANYKLRCEDVSFAIDHLAQLANDDARFKDKLELDHIGLAGHSFGAQTVQGIVGQQFAGRTLRDARVKAAIAFSPGVPARADARTAFADVDVPVFHFTGTNDQAPLVRDLTPAERRIPFDNIVHNDQYLLIFKDGDHAVFNGIPQRRRAAQLGNNISVEQYTKWHKLILDASLDFWNGYLRNEAAAKQSLQDFGKTLGEAGTFEHKSNP